MAFKFKGGVSGVSIRGVSLVDNEQVYGNINSSYSVEEIEGGTTTDIFDCDALFRTHEGATYFRNARISALGVCKYRSLTPSICSVDAYGEVTRKASGIGRVLLRTPYISKTIEFDFRDEANETSFVDKFISPIRGTIVDHISAQITSRIDGGMSIASNGLVYSTQDHDDKSYIRNENLWCHDLDLTAISPWNSNGKHTKAGTLITPRHLIGARHYMFPVGTVVRFVEKDAPYVVHERTVVGRSDSGLIGGDIAIYTLYSDLPATITPVKFFPADNQNYIRRVDKIKPPLFYLDQEEKALIADLVLLSQINISPPSTAPLSNFYETPIGGDSGNPLLFIVDGGAVLLSTFLGSSGGPAHWSRLEHINQMIADADAQAGVSTGYTVTEADLSAWPNFSTKNYLIENSRIDPTVNYATSDGVDDKLINLDAVEHGTGNWKLVGWGRSAVHDEQWYSIAGTETDGIYITADNTWQEFETSVTSGTQPTEIKLGANNIGDFSQADWRDVKLVNADTNEVVSHWPLNEQSSGSLDGVTAVDIFGGFDGTHIGGTGGSASIGAPSASAWVDVNGDGSVYRYHKASLTDYEEARIDGGVWKIYDEANALIATGNAGGDITAATFDNGYTFINP